jgi:hypothetical protein
LTSTEIRKWRSQVSRLWCCAGRESQEISIKNRVRPEIEQPVEQYAADFPTRGQVRISNELQINLDNRLENFNNEPPGQDVPFQDADGCLAGGKTS